MSTAFSTTLTWPRGNGEMATRIRSGSWTRSGLGPPEGWPTSLRTAVELMLDAVTPMLVLWGDTGIVLYNDRCIPLLAGRHPSLLGTAAKGHHSHRRSQLADIMQVVASGDSVIAKDDWLCPPRTATGAHRLQLGYAPLGNGHGEITGVWIQVLPENGIDPPLVQGSVEQMLPASVAAAGVASWLWSPTAGRVSLSSGAARVLGLTAEYPHTLPSFDFELVHPLDRAARRQMLEESAAAGTSFASEFRIVRPCDQQIAWVEERGRALRDPGTGEVSLNAVLWEITNRKRTPVNRARPDGTAALELETVGIAFFANDGRITDANSTYIALFGIEPADLAAGVVRRGDGTAPEWRTLTYRTVDEFNHSGRIAPHEKECIRRDGHRWWGLFGARRISESEGVEYVVDISSGMQAERELRDSERRMRSLIEGVPQIVWRSGEDGRWTWASPQWTDVTGQPQSQSLNFGWLDMVHPDDREEAQQAWHRANWNQSLETHYRLWDIGTNRYRAFKTRAAPLRGQAGTIVEWLGTSTDVEDLQLLHARQRLLVSELQHRTRNLLALVRTIARQTLQQEGIHKHALARFEERLASLSRVQGLLTRSTDEYVDLESLLHAELAALRGAGASRTHLRGPKVGLAAHQAQAIALAIHELATNALKYGALGKPDGHVRVEWTPVADAQGKRSLQFSWRESGVPLEPDAPRRRGFGHELLEDALPFSLDARTELRFAADGLEYTIELPLPDMEMLCNPEH